MAQAGSPDTPAASIEATTIFDRKGEPAVRPAAAASASTFSTQRRSAKLAPAPDGPMNPTWNGVWASAASAISASGRVASAAPIRSAAESGLSA